MGSSLIWSGPDVGVAARVPWFVRGDKAKLERQLREISDAHKERSHTVT
jgi:hypothetical protein